VTNTSLIYSPIPYILYEDYKIHLDKLRGILLKDRMESTLVHSTKSKAGLPACACTRMVSTQVPDSDNKATHSLIKTENYWKREKLSRKQTPWFYDFWVL